MSVRRALAAAAACLAFAPGGAPGASPSRPAYPPTPRRPVEDVYHAQRYVDPYRWLEDDSSDEVRAWAAVQTAFAERFLADVPGAAAMRDRVAELVAGTTTRSGLVVRAGRWFALRRRGDALPDLVVRDGPLGAERVLASGVSADGFAVSNDGTRVALAIRPPGRADATISVLDLAGRRDPADDVPQAGGGTEPVAILWDASGAGFVHTVRGPGGALALVHHTLGIPAYRDTDVFGRGSPPGTRYALRAPVDGSELAVFESAGAGAPATVLVSRRGGAFREVAEPAAGVALGAGDYVGDRLALVTSDDRAPRGRVVAVPPDGTARSSTELVPSGPEAIVGITPVAGGFATREIARGDGSARLFAASGALRANLPVTPFASVTVLAADPARGPLVLGTETDLAPQTWLAVDPATGAPLGAPVVAGSPAAGFDSVVAVSVAAPTRDPRVAVPLVILARRGLQPSAATPTILRAYGAFAEPAGPSFRPALLAWLERGGVYVRAAVRGGGDEGEPWHRAGTLENKTVSSNDVAASARWLATHGYGDAGHLGLAGDGAGGLTVGLAMTRNPTHYRAVVAIDGVFDLLRAETTPGGRADAAEFGSIADLVQFAYLQAESPYGAVRERGAYPATLLVTGARDVRFAAADSRKMIARLQYDSSSADPELLIQRPGTELAAGPRDAESDATATADELVFFASQLR